jgi:hypothetical protein
MTTKKFEISGRSAGQAGPATIARDQAMDRFIEGMEPMTTMTVQIPERLKHEYKKAAVDQKTTVKALVIKAMEDLLSAMKQ